MGLRRNDQVDTIFNAAHDDPLHTIRTGIKYVPLLADGARTGGTDAAVISGTGGTFHGTYNFAIPAPFAYLLLGITRTLTQQGTFGTINLTDLRVDSNPIGTLGNVASFITLLGEMVPAVTQVSAHYRVDVGTGVVGTWGVALELFGLKFDTVQGVKPA